MLLLNPKYLNLNKTLYMQYVIPPIKKKYLTPTKYPFKKTEDNFYEVQTTKCTKILYQTDTIRPTVQYSTVQCSTAQYSAVQYPA